VRWGRALPEEQGVDSRELIRLLGLISQEGLDVHSVIITRHGRIVAECYVHPYDREALHNVKSVSKSIMSAVVGIALREGLLSDLDQTIDEFFPDYFNRTPDDPKGDITLRHLLTMTAGLELDENGPVEGQIYASDDWIGATLARPLAELPGTRFNYSTPLAHLMSGVLSQASGRNLLNLAQQYVFEPLGIRAAQWSTDPQGHSFGGAELFLTPLAMARFGVLYLDQGRWQKRQVVPAEWVGDSTANHLPEAEQGEQYGYWWWRSPSGSYHARGWGGQVISIKPDTGLVTVITAADMGAAAKILVALAQAEPGVVSLPPNPAAVEELAQLVDVLEHPRPQVPSELPAIAAEISGRRFVFDTNELDFEHLTLECGEATVCTLRLGRDGKTVEGEVGLDGLYRVSDTGSVGEMPSANRLALRGNWLDNRSFAVDYHELGRPSHWSIGLTFAEGRLRAVIHMRPLDLRFELSAK